MKIIFMGTSEFAVPILEKIITSANKVVAVFTAIPKPQGRGLLLTKTPVHKIAEKNNIVVHTPITLKSNEVYSIIDNIEADVIIVAAYGFLIPKTILESKKYKCINVHPSLLPRFRGAAPLQHTILAGDTSTGITIMQMDEGLDTGPILLQEQFSIENTIILPDLQNICACLGAQLLLQVLSNIDNITTKQQNSESTCYAHKLTKKDSFLNWEKTAFELNCQIRALNPWPGTFFIHNQKNIKIFKSTYDNIQHSYTPGTILTNPLAIACKQGLLFPTLLQCPGKRIMNAIEFLNGYKMSLNT